MDVTKFRDLYPDPTARIAALLEVLGQEVGSLGAAVADVRSAIKAIDDRVTAIEQDMTRYRGFIGGVSFIVGGAMIAWNLTKEWLHAQFSS